LHTTSRAGPRADASGDEREPTAGSAQMAAASDSSLTGARVLVTGGSGFIGRALCASLAARGADVRNVDLHASADPDLPTTIGDLRDPRVVEQAVTGELDGIVHLAAKTSVLQSIAQPRATTEHNVGVTAALLERSREVGVPRFLLASTNAVTGDVGTATISEERPLRPLTPYGATKAACEMLLSGYAAPYGMQTCALRLTNVYGPGMAHKDSFVPRLMRAASSGDKVQIYGDGLQRRDLVNTADVCRAFALAWEEQVEGPLIVGSGRSITVLDLVDAAREATGRTLPTEHIDPKPGEMPAVIVSIDRACGFGYRPGVSLLDGLREVWDEFRAALPAA
jgi:UDP-glucose 4-epimerase